MRVYLFISLTLKTDYKMETNNIIHKATKTQNGETINVTIRLNDECKNGHQDFSITSEIYQAGKPKTDRWMISAGANHEDILEFFPEFKIFIDLHLCDYLGIPMYAISNGFYHLKNGFNAVTPEDEKFKSDFCEYYRVTPEQFNILKGAHSQDHYGILVNELEIPKQWKKQADEAIKILEKLTGNKFIVDSTKNQLGKYSDPSAYDEEKERIKQGYYSEEKQAEREEEKRNKYKQELKDRAKQDIDKIKRELSVKLALFDIGGKHLVDNTIYYNHTDTVSFNWRNYTTGKRYTQAEADEIIKKVPIAGLKHTVE